MKLYTIDIGNTHMRIAVVTVETTVPCEIIHFSLSDAVPVLRELFKSEGTDIPAVVAFVVDSVQKTLPVLLKSVGHRGELIFCTNKGSRLLTSCYSSSLGMDRYVDAAAAVHRFPGKDLIIIDSGTATTVDFVRRDKTFLGGYILPGIGLKASVIGEKTDKLPTLDPYSLRLTTPPVTTDEAVAGGLLLDSAGGIEKAITTGRTLLKSPVILACGGGWEIIRPYVSMDIVSMEDLTLFGTALLGAEIIQTRGLQ